MQSAENKNVRRKRSSLCYNCKPPQNYACGLNINSQLVSHAAWGGCRNQKEGREEGKQIKKNNTRNNFLINSTLPTRALQSYANELLILIYLLFAPNYEEVVASSIRYDDLLLFYFILCYFSSSVFWLVDSAVKWKGGQGTVVENPRTRDFFFFHSSWSVRLGHRVLTHDLLNTGPCWFEWLKTAGNHC